jgi:hypothetical protein
VIRTTKAFDKPLSDAGVTFEGFEGIRIPSREAVREQLDDFLSYCLMAKKPAIRVILGEWGEGKTDAYRRYLLPKCKKQGDIALFVSASTLANSFRQHTVQELSGTTNLQAVRLLVALFNAAREEADQSGIPSLKEYKSAESFLSNTLSTLSRKEKRILVFVDEFEELLLHQDILKQIISGIKEIINGSPKDIDEGGKYAGCLHLVIAATPDAYYRLAVSEETALIFGGLGRRTGIINLPQIRKTEAMGFLHSLLLHAFDGALPDPPPLVNAGILETLVKISQGNPGTMVSLLTRMLNAARSDSKRMRIIDDEVLLDFLKNEHIFIYGGETPCIERETYARFVKILGEQSQPYTGKKIEELFRILAGELRPVSAGELSRRLQINENQVKNLINIINEELKSREGIEKAILKVSRLKEDRTATDIANAFREYITEEHDRKIVKMDNYVESLDEFNDKITFLEIQKGAILPTTCLPSDHSSVSVFFEGIGRDKSVEIGNMIGRRLTSNEDCYLASDEFLAQVYPTPVPRELEFLRNRDSRLRLWRDVTKNLADQYDHYMPQALIDILRRSGAVKFSEIRTTNTKHHFDEIEFRDFTFATLTVAVNGDVKSTDIEEISRWIKQNSPQALCCLLVFTGEITSEAEEKIADKELGKKGDNLLLTLRIHPTLAKRILSIYRAVTDFSEQESDQNLLTTVIGRVVSQEIDFASKLKEWLSEQKELGILVEPPRIESTSNLREFADCLKFFVNFMETQSEPREIFERNQKELLGFVRYNSRLGLIPDIELPKFERLITDLHENGFLKKGDRNKYSITEHPVELRILRILKKYTKLTQTEVEQQFISSKSKLLQDIFLPILEYKGRILRSGHHLELLNPRELYEQVEGEYNRFNRLLSAKNELKRFGFVYQWKKKGDHRFVSLSKFEAYVDGLHRRAKDQLGGREERVLQKLSLLKTLLRYFEEDIIPLFEKAAKQGKQVQEEANVSFAEFEEKIKEVAHNCDVWLKLKFSGEDVEEYKQSLVAFSAVGPLIKSKEDQMQSLVDSFKEEQSKRFYFNETEEQAWFFNPKLYQISARVDELKNVIERASWTLKDISDKFQQLDAKQVNVTNRMLAKPDSVCRTSSSIWNEMSLFSKDVTRGVEPQELKSTSLEDIKSHVDGNHKIITGALEELEKAVSGLSDLLGVEMSWVSRRDEGVALRDHCTLLFDTEESKVMVTQLTKEISISEKEYQDFSKAKRFADTSELLDTISTSKTQLTRVEKSLNLKVTAIEDGWRKFAADIVTVLDTLESALKIVGKKRKIDTVSLQKGISDLRAKIEKRSAKDLSLKFSRILKLKNEILEEFYEAVKSVLDRKEAKVLQAVVDRSEKGQKTWLREDELYDIANRMAISKTEMTAILRKLANSGLITIGVSVPY